MSQSVIIILAVCGVGLGIVGVVLSALSGKRGVVDARGSSVDQNIDSSDTGFHSADGNGGDHHA